MKQEKDKINTQALQGKKINKGESAKETKTRKEKKRKKNK